ncbi:MAG: aminopeptidase P family protein [Phycisphaeraceae bacterium]|nr:aminopeptidase P family protein [Phycisphaeraceae bacterium]
MELRSLQEFMGERRIDAWLLHDFRNTNPIFLRLFPGKRHVTRRSFAIVPAQGEPKLITQSLDEGAFATGESTKALKRVVYSGWKDLHATLAREVGMLGRVAMDYSPGDALPVMDVVPSGVLDVVRNMGLEVVSSANLVQVSIARWGAEAKKKHDTVSKHTGEIMPGAFAFIAERLRAGKEVFELEVAEWVRAQFTTKGLEWPDGPIVSVNGHAADPHYEPIERTPTKINKGDWVLIDMWARVKGERDGEENVYSDITWTGFVGKEVPPGMKRVFDSVRNARDASVKLAQESWKSGKAVQGWQLDEAARGVFERDGFLPFVKHRTGHSLSPGVMVHGMGMNLDNFETRDTREMLGDIGFTIEPGLYLSKEEAERVCGKGTPSFGVRNEINVYVDPKNGPQITSCVQNEPVLIG